MARGSTSRVPADAAIREQAKFLKDASDTAPLQWNGTGDPVTYVMLQDDPDFFLEKVTDHFGIIYDERISKRGVNWINRDTDGSYSKNPNDQNFGVDDVLNKSPLPNLYTNDSDILARQNMRITGGMSATGLNEYMYPYTGGYYRLSINHPDPEIGTRQSRKIKYFYGVQELQNIIEEDLITGISGYNVSPVGDINKTSYGPYMLQARTTGFNPRNGLYISYISDPEAISGSIQTYAGSDDPSLPLPRHDVLRFHCTGSGSYNYSYRADNLLENAIYSVEAHLSTYDFSVGRFLNAEESFCNLVHDSGIFEEDLVPGLDVGKIYGERVFNVNQDMIQSINGAKLYASFLDVEYITDKPIDPNDPQKVFHITGAREFNNNQLIDSYGNPMPPNSFFNLVNVVGNNYTEEDYFWCGAPSGYIHPRLIDVHGVRISGCDTLSGFIVPEYTDIKTIGELSLIHITDCKNFKDFLLHDGVRNIAKVKITGTMMDTQNRFHQLANPSGNYYHYPTSEYPEIPQFFLSGYVAQDVEDGYSTELYPFPRSIHFKKPDYLMSDYPSDIELDRDFHCPCGHKPAPFESRVINFIDIRHNNLNQTGVYSWLIAAMQTNVISGVFRCEGQNVFKSHQNAVFDGSREDPYEAEHKILYGENYDSNNPPQYLIKDVNNFFMDGVQYLLDRGWRVTYQSSNGVVDQQGYYDQYAS